MFLPRSFLTRSQEIDRRRVLRSHTRGNIWRELLGSKRPISKTSACIAVTCRWTASSVFFVAITLPLDKLWNKACKACLIHDAIHIALLKIERNIPSSNRAPALREALTDG